MTIELEPAEAESLPPQSPDDFESMPDPTGIETTILEASRFADAGLSDAAEQAYLRADGLLGAERSPRHAEVLVCLALLLRRRGELTQAASYFDMALSIFPEHRAALSQRYDLARERGEIATAAALHARMVGFCESTEARLHVLNEVADDAVAAAVAAIREAIDLRPGDAELRLRLGALLDAS